MITTCKDCGGLRADPGEMFKCQPCRCSSELMPFIDNKGHTIFLHSQTTIEDMVRLGINLHLEAKGKPLPDNWYAHSLKTP